LPSGHESKREASRRKRSKISAAVVTAACLAARHAPADVSWLGANGSSWTTNANWSNNAGPATTDIVDFNDPGASTSPGNVTSLLNANRTIGGLQFNDSSGKYHTLDLNSDTLTITGNVTFNQDKNTATTETIRHGSLNVSGSYANFTVGTTVSGNAVGTADLSGLTSFTGNLQNFYVGASPTGNATGTLLLGPSVNITAALMQVGRASNPGNTNQGSGSLSLGLATTFVTPEFDVGVNNSSGNVSIVNGGTFNLGSATTPASLTVSNYTDNDGDGYTATVNLTGATFNATLSQLIVGQKTGGGNYGAQTATLLGGTGGTITIGSATTPGSIYVGRMITAGVNQSLNAQVDLAGLSSVTATVGNFIVGANQTASGAAVGTMALAATNNITATLIDVGDTTANNSSLTFGLNNTVVATTFQIGENGGNGSVTAQSGGTFTLGNTAKPTSLNVGNYTIDAGSTATATLDLTGVTFNAVLSNLVVAQKTGGGNYGTETGSVSGAVGGTITIGSPAAPGSVAVAQTLAAGVNLNTVGSLGLGGMSSMTANLSCFNVGIGLANTGGASGTVTLPAANNITAQTIDIGDWTVGNSGVPATGSLALGRTNTILATNFYIGNTAGSGSVTIPTGGTLTLGSSASPSGLYIGNTTAGNGTDTGLLDLTGATFNAVLSQLTVGLISGGNSYLTSSGTLVGGAAGTVVIGSAASPGNLFVGRSLNANSNVGVTGTVDFSGLSSFTANLTTMSVGTAPAAYEGSAGGAVKLAAVNSITATAVVIGDYGGGNDTLALGNTNTIQTPQLSVASNSSDGSVTLPSGGTLVLGSLSQRTSISIAGGPAGNASTNENPIGTGLLDVSAGTFTACLASVNLSNKSSGGNGNATLSIGSSSANFVDVNSVVIAGNGSTGVLNYAGGTMYAGSIAAGGGAATFNWTGGRLSVGSFGTAAIPFNLNNTGNGDLAPATDTNPISTTSIFGNYNQGAAATTSFDIAGTVPGSSYDQVNISGTAMLAGTIALNVTGGFVPAVGDAFLLETYSTNSGTYKTIIPPALPAGVAFQLDYSNPGQLILELVAPAAQSYVGASPFGTFGTGSNYSPAGTPGTTSSVSIINTGSSSRTVTVSASTTVDSIYLKGSTMPVDLEIGSGVTLATAAQLDVDNNATMHVQAGGVVNAAGGITGAGATTVAAGGSLTAMSVRQAYFTADGTVTIPQTSPHNSSASLSVIGQLTLAGSPGAWTGLFDLGNSDLDIQSGNLATVTNQVAQAYNLAGGAKWNGGGITSTAAENDTTHLTALGVIQNDQGGSPVYTSANTFDGTAPGAGDILVKYTYFGDANLDGKVDGSDYSLIDAGYASHGALTGWYNGDFNYDGVVDGSDYALIDNAFNNQTGNLSTPATAATPTAQVAVVPEPSCLILPALATFLAGPRRRNRRSR
jgi:fibronectin-binding autotransporter adhesin